MKSEKEIEEKVIDYLKKRKYEDIRQRVKIRGKIADIIALKNNEITAVEVKGEKGDILGGIERAIHYSRCCNYSYLAIPKEKADKEIELACKNVGIGLLVVNKNVKEVLKPKRRESLESVKSKILKLKAKNIIRKKPRRSLLENLFTSRVRVNILKLLIFNSDKEFHLREIARKIDANPTYVKKELQNLKEINLVSESKKGNLSLFKINRNSLIFPELKNIFIKTEYFLELIKKSLKKLKIDFAFIFGSFAKGKESKESDIDLFVVGDVEEDELLKTIQKIEMQSGREINYILWKKSLFMKRAKKHHLLNEIAKNPVIMLVGDEDELRKIIG